MCLSLFLSIFINIINVIILPQLYDVHRHINDFSTRTCPRVYSEVAYCGQFILLCFFVLSWEYPSLSRRAFVLMGTFGSPSRLPHCQSIWPYTPCSPLHHHSLGALQVHPLCHHPCLAHIPAA